MAHDVTERFFNVFLRGVTLLSRFALLLFLAKFLEPRDVGSYGLLTAVIGYFVYIVGFEFYVYANREVISHNNKLQFYYLKNQLFFGLGVYLISIPVVLSVFKLSNLPFEYFYLSLMILFSEYVSLELYRHLVATSLQLKASFLLFIRSGLWPIVATSGMIFYEELQYIDFILYSWLTASMVATIYGAYILGFKWPVNYKSFFLCDLAWVKKGVNLTFLYFLAALSVQAIFTVDRFIFESIVGLEVLAAYILFISFIFAIASFVDSGVFAYLYPRLVAIAGNKKYFEFYDVFNGMIKQVFWVVMALSIIVSMLYFFGVEYLDRDVYEAYWLMLPLLLIAVFFQLMGMSFQIGLYALHKDKIITYTKISLVFIFLLMVGLLVDRFSFYAVPVALIAVFVVQTILYFFYFSVYKRDFLTSVSEL